MPITDPGDPFAHQLLVELPAIGRQAFDTINLLEQGLTASNAERDKLQRDLAACQAGEPTDPTDPTDPEPPVDVATVFGACPRNNANDFATLRTMWGAKVKARWFDTADGLDRIPQPPFDMDGHFSWKTLQDGSITLDDVRAAVTHLNPARHMIETEHEADVKHQDSGNLVQLEQRRALKAAFHQFAHQLDPAWRTVNTVAFWRFTTPQRFADFERLYVFEADYLGVDFDGIPSAAGKPYYPMADPAILDRIRLAADRHYGGRLTVPEFGQAQRPDDPTGSLRASWMRQQVPAIVNALDPEQFHLFDSASFLGSPLVDPGEIEYWRTLVASNPA